MYDATVPFPVSSPGTDRGPVVFVVGKNDDEVLSLSDIDVDAVVNLVQTRQSSGDEENPSQSAASRTSGNEKSSRLPEEHSSRVLLMPPPRKPPYQFILLQQWEGTVTDIRETEFTAELRDAIDPASPREEAVFDIEEISPGDLSLFVLGSVFRWSIGYRTSIEGQRERVSHFRFVRIPGWRKSAIADMKHQAAALRGRFPINEQPRRYSI